MPDSPSTIEWQGPTVHASVATGIGAPKIDVQITVPTGGYEFSIERVEAKGKDVVVEAKLVHPGDDEIVTQALVTLRHQATAPLPTGRVLVRVAEWKRGVQYLVAPASQLAAVVSY